MVFQPGRSAVEAGGAAPNAGSNLVQVQIARVREFPEKNFLLADEDFAGAFASFEAAVLAGSRMGKGSTGAESMPVALSSNGGGGTIVLLSVLLAPGLFWLL